MVNKAEDSGQNPSHSVQQTPYSRARHRSRLSRDPRSRDMVSALVELTVWWEKDVAERGRVSVPRATCQGAMCCVTGAQRRKHVIEPGDDIGQLSREGQPGTTRPAKALLARAQHVQTLRGREDHGASGSCIFSGA